MILAADRRAARSIVVMKSTMDKFRELGESVVLSFSGEPGDATNFAEFVQANVRLYEMRNELPLGVHAAAHYTRRLLADSLRSRVSIHFIIVSSPRPHSYCASTFSRRMPTKRICSLGAPQRIRMVVPYPSYTGLTIWPPSQSCHLRPMDMPPTLFSLSWTAIIVRACP